MHKKTKLNNQQHKRHTKQIKQTKKNYLYKAKKTKQK